MSDTPASQLHGDAPAAITSQAESDRRELAFVAMERTRMPMVITDPRQHDNPIVLANRSFLEEVGYEASEVIGRNCRMLQGPDTDPAAIARIRAAIAEERDITIELLNYRKDGSPFWNQLYISPVHDDDGRLLYFFASQMDATRRRKAEDLEAAEHLLLREVDHRAKNALALVQGIVRLTKRTDPDVYAELVQGRVDALARAHSILADAHWRSVPLELVVRGELDAATDERVTILGEQALLAVAQVQPVALLMHELAANARIHGALSGTHGRVSITWGLGGGASGIALRWTEEGGPPPPRERPRGYGHTMIDAIASRQLGGIVSYDWRSEGLVVDLAIPGTREQKSLTPVE
jgi:PAS domain S-box-containing protein